LRQYGGAADLGDLARHHAEFLAPEDLESLATTAFY
jgi:hypothetical protein